MKCRSWTDEDILFLKENCIHLSTREIAKKLNRSVSAINCRKHSLNLNRKVKWTERDTIFLKDNYPLMSYSEISKNLNCPVWYIKRKTWRLDFDEQEIIRLYKEEKISSTRIAIKMGCSDKTILSILKTNNIKIGGTSKVKIDDAVIKDKYINGATILQLMKLFKCDDKRITNSLHKQSIKTDLSSRLRYFYSVGKITPHNKGEPSPLLRKRNLENNPMKHKSARLKSSLTQKRNIATGKTKNPIFNLGKYGQRGMVGENSPCFGIKKTKEHREKLSRCKKGIKCPKSSISLKRGYKEGRIVCHSKGKTKENYKPLMRTSLSQTGDKNHNWRNGSSFLPYTPEFNRILKLKIKERDSFTCQECKRTELDLINENRYNRTLRIHHIDYNKKNHSPLNLISLCQWCHMKTNTNRVHWEEYFKMKIFMKEFFNPKNILAFNENKQLIGIQRG